MIGDDEVRMVGFADGPFHKTFPVMLARRINAFAAPVGERVSGGQACQAQPIGKIAPYHIAVTGVLDPSRHETQCNSTGAATGLSCGFFKIQQTEIVLAALTHHRLL